MTEDFGRTFYKVISFILFIEKRSLRSEISWVPWWRWNKAKFRSKRGCFEWAQVRSSPLRTAAGKGGRKRTDRMGSGQEKPCRQTGAEGLAVTSLLFRWHELRQGKWNTAGMLQQVSPRHKATESFVICLSQNEMTSLWPRRFTSLHSLPLRRGIQAKCVAMLLYRLLSGLDGKASSCNINYSSDDVQIRHKLFYMK